MIFSFFIIFIIIFIFIRFRKEQFENYKLCKNRKLNTITQTIFDNFGIKQNNDLFDVFMPCGYKTAESQLKKLILKTKKYMLLKDVIKLLAKIIFGYF